MTVLGEKRGKYKPRKGPNRYSKTKERLPLVAAYIRAGHKPTHACRLAGFPESTVRTATQKIVKSEEVQKLIAAQNNSMVEAGRAIRTQDLGEMAKVVVRDGMTRLKPDAKEGKVLLGYARTGAEMAGMIGGHNELHLHQHNELPECVKAMLIQEMQRIQSEESGVSIQPIPLLAQEAPQAPVPIIEQPTHQPIEHQPFIPTDSAWEIRQRHRFLGITD